MSKIKSIHSVIKKLKVPFSGHYSDLYIPVNEQTRSLIENYEYKNNVTMFINQLDGKKWYDIPFANEDFKK